MNNAIIEWDREGHPHARDYGDIYFSVNSPLEESRHVFLVGNNLPERMPAVGSRPLLVGECGFGFGLNFLITAEYFCKLAPTDSRLHFISCELHPVKRKDLQRYYARLPSSLLPLAAAMLSHYPEQGKGLHRLQFSYRQRYITLDLVYADACHAFSNISMPGPGIDAWYLDGFSPSRNKAMWQPRLFRELAALSHAGTTIASYSVAGDVRRNLEAAGFRIEKSPGFGNKRHMLSGVFTQTTAENRLGWTTPWPDNSITDNTVAIIGAGLAGCATAHALASRGVNVTLFDKNSAIAEGSSGNPRGIVHFNPARKLDPAARFRLQAFNFATRHYQVLSRNHDTGWQAGGVVHLPATGKDRVLHEHLATEGLYDSDLLQALTPARASELAGIELAEPGALWLSAAGSISPAALCHAWATHTGITLVSQTRADRAVWKDGQWTLSLSGPQGVHEKTFARVVLCTNELPDLVAGLDYPCIANHGQTDTYQVNEAALASALPKLAISQKGYVVPWHGQGKSWLMVGGSYAPGRHTEDACETLRAKNTELVQQLTPALMPILVNCEQSPQSRCGTRISTPDYLPLAGPVEDTQACRDIFAELTRNARKTVHAKPAYLPGLYVNLGHGSSGLTTTPLLGEYLASLICGDPLPLLKEDIQAIHPLRFLIRTMKKQQ